MKITSNYKNAFAEVYEILNLLDKEEYKKIPQDVINVIETNRNCEYNYHINNEIELCKQPMLPETKAILYNIFRDYLSTQNQRQKIIEMQNIEREKLKMIAEQKLPELISLVEERFGVKIKRVK